MVIENDLSKYVKKNSIDGIIDYIGKNCHLKRHIEFFSKDGKGKKWLDIDNKEGGGVTCIQQ